MPGDLFNQIQATAPAAGVGGVGGAVSAIVLALKLFATAKDVEMVRHELRAEMAEKYLTKEAIEPLREDIRYIRDRIDAMSQRP